MVSDWKGQKKKASRRNAALARKQCSEELSNEFIQIIQGSWQKASFLLGIQTRHNEA